MRLSAPDLFRFGALRYNKDSSEKNAREFRSTTGKPRGFLVGLRDVDALLDYSYQYV